ncbi:MAG: hypothetical protein GWN16_04430, partial [Calditrichae bacterium]|nr:hypothetical protein [Calditrichia bacterium]
MYDSAVKWNTVTGKPGMAGYEVRKRLSTTALENKIMPTIKGIEKLEDKLAALENKIAELVKTPTDAGVTIRADELLSEFDKLRKEAWRAGTGTSKKDVRQINAIEKDFIDVHGVWRVEIEDEVFVISRPQDRRPGQ